MTTVNYNTPSTPNLGIGSANLGNLPSFGVAPQKPIFEQPERPEYGGNAEMEGYFDQYGTDLEAYRKGHDRFYKGNRMSTSSYMPSPGMYKDYLDYKQREQDYNEQMRQQDAEQKEYQQAMKKYDSQREKLIKKVQPQLQEMGLGHLSGMLGEMDGSQLTQALGLIQDYKTKMGTVEKKNEERNEAKKSLTEGFGKLSEELENAKGYVEDADRTDQIEDELSKLRDRTGDFRDSIDESIADAKEEYNRLEPEMREEFGKAKGMLRDAGDISDIEEFADRIADIDVPDPSDVNPMLNKLHPDTKNQIAKAEKVFNGNVMKTEALAGDLVNTARGEWDEAKAEFADTSAQDMLVMRQATDAKYNNARQNLVARAKDGEYGAVQEIQKVNAAQNQSLSNGLAQVLSANSKLKNQINASAASGIVGAATKGAAMKASAYENRSQRQAQLAALSASNNQERAAQAMAVEQMKLNASSTLGNLYSTAAQVLTGGKQLQANVGKAHGNLTTAEYQTMFNNVRDLYEMETGGEKAKIAAAQNETQMGIQGQQAISDQKMKIGQMLQQMSTAEFGAQLQLQDFITNLPIYSVTSGDMLASFAQLMENQKNAPLRDLARQQATTEMQQSVRDTLYPEEPTKTRSLSVSIGNNGRSYGEGLSPGDYARGDISIPSGRLRGYPSYEAPNRDMFA